MLNSKFKAQIQHCFKTQHCCKIHISKDVELDSDYINLKTLIGGYMAPRKMSANINYRNIVSSVTWQKRTCSRAHLFFACRPEQRGEDKTPVMINFVGSPGCCVQSCDCLPAACHRAIARPLRAIAWLLSAIVRSPACCVRSLGCCVRSPACSVQSGSC